MNARPLAGIFVGGKSARMGGRPKGLLAGPSGKPLLEHLVEIARAECRQVVLVGSAEPYRARFADLDVLGDAPGIEGPLAGLRSLLDFAQHRPALALACDLPFLEPPLLQRLARAPTIAEVLAPRAAPDAPWEPLLCRYDAPRVLPKLDAALARGVRAFQELFSELDVAELSLEVNERGQLRDWDSPSDIDSRENG